MVLTINPTWFKEDLTCHFCGETRSVKYKTKTVFEEKEICVCNKCALNMIGTE